MRFSSVLQLLKSPDSMIVKRGLQYLCDNIERGAYLNELQRTAVIETMSAHMSSPNIVLRRWLYKAVGLIGDHSFVPYLLGQLRDGEGDRENLTWIAAALYSIVGKDTNEHLAARDLNPGTPPFLFASLYFQRKRAMVEETFAKEVLDSNDHVSLKWLSLLFGSSERGLTETATSSSDIIRNLNQHTNSDVAEYSIWALYTSPLTEFSDTAVPPQDLFGLPANIRRWYYRLLAKKRQTIATHFDLVKQGSRDRSIESREGLAIGLSLLEPDSSLSKFLVSWYERDSDFLIRVHLREHFERYREINPEYNEIITSEDALYSSEVPSRLRTTIGKEFAMSLPQVRDERDVESYILAIDTVDFSSESDQVQVRIFKDIMQDLSDLDIMKNINTEDVISLITGDGLILIFKEAKNRFLPLHVAMQLLDIYASARKKRLRCGINSGLVHWMQMDNNMLQAIGHALNWAVRVMGAAGENKILVSETYFSTVAGPGRTSLVNIEFEKVHGLETKKKEPIEAREVVIHKGVR